PTLTPGGAMTRLEGDVMSNTALRQETQGPGPRYEIVTCRIGARLMRNYKRAERATRRRISKFTHPFEDVPFGLLNQAREAIGIGKVGAALQWVHTYLRKSSAKLVVFAHYLPVRHKIAARLGGCIAVLIDADTCGRRASVARFLNEPTCRVLVTSPRLKDIEAAVAATGTAVFVDYDFVPHVCERA